MGVYHGPRTTEKEEQVLHPQSQAEADATANQSKRQSTCLSKLVGLPINDALLLIRALRFHCLDVANPRLNRNHRLTLAQNYRRLGLTAKLSHYAGGIEKEITHVPDSKNLLPQRRDDPLAITAKTANPLLPSEVHVERDPTTGAIIQITDPHWESAHSPLNDPLNELEHTEERSSDSTEIESPKGIVGELERQASAEVKKKPRHQSQREVEWLEALLKKYEDDYELMARDRKLNPYQQSTGEIRKRMKNWKNRG